MEQAELSLTAGGGGGCKMLYTQLKNNLAVFKKVKLYQLYDPVIPLLNAYLKETKCMYHTKIRTQMFIVALFIIA